MQRWETLLPVVPQDLHLDLCAVPLAGAVAGSASFPPLVGPITFRVGEEELYWHTGDGGLYENQGVESILFAFLKRLQERKARRALIIAFDSSYPFSVGSRRLTLRAEPFSLFTYDFSRIPSIMEERASAYQALFFRSLQLEGVIPDPQTVRVVVAPTHRRGVEGRSQRPAGGLSRGGPAAGLAPGREGAHRGDPHAVLAPLGVRPALLVTAAAKVVAQKEQTILNFWPASSVRPRRLAAMDGGVDNAPMKAVRRTGLLGHQG